MYDVYAKKVRTLIVKTRIYTEMLVMRCYALIAPNKLQLNLFFINNPFLTLAPKIV